MKVLITGGTGALGSQLVDQLILRGHEVYVTSRNPSLALKNNPYRVLQWPLLSPAEIQAAQNCEVVINLAGESIAGDRWTDAQKLRIRRSRIALTDELVGVLAGSTQLRLFLSASAIGFYGHRKSEVLTEDSPVGEGFLAEVCREWEASALKLKNPAVRTVLLRTGVVLDRQGGFLTELEPLYRHWLGGPIGNGDQFVSWIHVQDWINSVLFILDQPSLRGAVNLVAPEPVTNRSLSLVYGALFKQPWQLPAPTLALKIMLGEMSHLAIDSQNVRPEKLLAAGYKFGFPYLREALENLYDITDKQRDVLEKFSSHFWVKADIKKVFAYFADDRNLERVRWRTQITSWRPPHEFTDIQLEGPYHIWEHTHRFAAAPNGWTRIEDHIRFQLKFGCAGRLIGLPLARREISNIFNQRGESIRQELEKLH